MNKQIRIHHKLTLRRSIYCFVVQVMVPYEVVCTPELIVLCLCQPKVMTLTRMHVINFKAKMSLQLLTRDVVL